MASKSKTAEQYARKHRRGRLIKWGVIGAVLYVLLSMATVRQLAVAALPFAFNIVVLITMQVVQFVAYFGGMMYFISGTRTDQVMPGDARSVTLDDYRGQPTVTARAEQMARVLEGQSTIKEMGGIPPKGLLLIGPPGTGKSYLAQCLAGEVGVPFLLLDASGLTSMWMGVGSIKVIRFFAKLHKLAKIHGAAVAFLDEVDAIGAARGGVEGQQASMAGRGMFGGAGGMGVLNTLLSQMDGLDQPPGLLGKLKRKFYGWLKLKLPKQDYHVLVIAATNRPSVLDAALLRSGRFGGWQWRIETPSEQGVGEIVRYYLRDVSHDDGIDVDRVASVLRGSTPADIKSTISCTAVILAEREGRDKIIEADIYQGAVEARIGLEMPVPDPYEPDQRVIAFHEAGHLIALASLFPELQGLMATIVPHAGTGNVPASLGMVIPAFRNERQSLPIDFLLRRLMLSMAGREAVTLISPMHTGFGGDRANMQNTIISLVAEGALGYQASLTMDGEGGNPLHSLDILEKARLGQLLANATQMTTDILEENGDALKDLAELLLEEGTLTSEKIEAFLAEHPIPDKSEEATAHLLDALQGGSGVDGE